SQPSMSWTNRSSQTPAVCCSPCHLPPLLLHWARNFLRALPCSPLALACSEQAFEIACLSAALVGDGLAELDGACANAPPTAMVSDRRAAHATARIMSILMHRFITFLPDLAAAP